MSNQVTDSSNEIQKSCMYYACCCCFCQKQACCRQCSKLCYTWSWCYICCACSYTHSVRKALKDLVFASIPVFIAVSVAQFVQAIISYITAHSRDSSPINLQIGQQLVFALIVYTGGKYLSYALQRELIQPEETRSNFIVLLEKNQYVPVIFGTMAEISSFAWKQFAVSVILTYFYQYQGIDVALGVFLIWCLTCVLLIAFSYFIMHSVFSLDHDIYYEVLADFDSDSFGLSVAFVLTVLWALYTNEIGVDIFDNEGYLFEWQTISKTHHHHTTTTTDDYYNTGTTIDDYTYGYYYSGSTDDTLLNHGFSIYYFLYAFGVSFFVAIIFLIEDRIGCKKYEENGEGEDEEDVMEVEGGGEESNHRASHAEDEELTDLIRPRYTTANRLSEIANRKSERLSRLSRDRPSSAPISHEQPLSRSSAPRTTSPSTSSARMVFETEMIDIENPIARIKSKNKKLESSSSSSQPIGENQTEDVITKQPQRPTSRPSPPPPPPTASHKIGLKRIESSTSSKDDSSSSSKSNNKVVDVLTSNSFRYQSVFNTSLDFWHTILGSLTGVAFFALVVDEIDSYAGNAFGTFVLILLCGIFILWRAPFFISITLQKQNKYKERFENHSQKLKDQQSIKQQYSSSLSMDSNNNNNNNESISEKSISSNPSLLSRDFSFETIKAGEWSFPIINGCIRCCHTLGSYYYHMKMHHKTVMLLSVRLTLGWTWEVTISKALDLAAEDADYTNADVIYFNFWSLFTILILSFLIHWFIRFVDSPPAPSHPIRQETPI